MSVRVTITLLGLLIATASAQAATKRPQRSNPFQPIFDFFSGNRSNNGSNSGSDAVSSAPQYDTPDENISVVIDRNPGVQQMKIYIDGTLRHTLPVSTGRESFDIPTNFHKQPECSTTPTGDFRPQVLRELHRSSTWLHENPQTGLLTEGSEMWHSVFFNGGIATHAADGSGLNTLGPKNENDPRQGGSGGCVRMGTAESKLLFDYLARKDSAGNYMKQNPRNANSCQSVPSSGPTYNEALEWPVCRNSVSANIRVVDTRSPEAQAAAAKKCTDDTAQFKAAKDDCMLDKVINQRLSAGQTVDESQFAGNPAKATEYLNSALAGLGQADKKKFGFECNRNIYMNKAMAKCKLARLNSIRGRVVIDPNQGMFDMGEVEAAFQTLTPEQRNSTMLTCNQRVNKAAPMPLPRPQRDANGNIVPRQTPVETITPATPVVPESSTTTPYPRARPAGL